MQQDRQWRQQQHQESVHVDLHCLQLPCQDQEQDGPVHPHHMEVSAPVWKIRMATCPHCGEENDKTHRQARTDTKPWWRGWHCVRCKRQTLAKWWKCSCGNMLAQCPLHSMDPEAHRTTRRWNGKSENGGKNVKVTDLEDHPPPIMRPYTVKGARQTNNLVVRSTHPTSTKYQVNADKFPKLAKKIAMWESQRPQPIINSNSGAISSEMTVNDGDCMSHPRIRG